jgi:hypothetical protein
MNSGRLSIIIFSAVMAMAGTCFAQQLWSLNDGKTFEGEFVTVIGHDVVFRNSKGKDVKIPFDRISAESRRQIELEQPPALKFSFVNKTVKKNFPSGINDHTQRPPEIRSHYGIKIKQTSAGKYNHELKLELFVIGQERIGDKYILLDRNDSSFSLTKENNRMYEFRSDREVALQNYVVYFHEDQTRGEKYHGYLAVVTDVRGEEIGVSATHDWLYENVENLRKLSIGNYMDETCTRTFPTRPRAAMY